MNYHDFIQRFCSLHHGVFIISRKREHIFGSRTLHSLAGLVFADAYGYMKFTDKRSMDEYIQDALKRLGIPQTPRFISLWNTLLRRHKAKEIDLTHRPNGAEFLKIYDSLIYSPDYEDIFIEASELLGTGKVSRIKNLDNQYSVFALLYPNQLQNTPNRNAKMFFDILANWLIRRGKTVVLLSETCVVVPYLNEQQSITQLNQASASRLPDLIPTFQREGSYSCRLCGSYTVNHVCRLCNFDYNN